MALIVGCHRANTYRAASLPPNLMAASEPSLRAVDLYVIFQTTRNAENRFTAIDGPVRPYPSSALHKRNVNIGKGSERDPGKTLFRNPYDGELLAV